jgi:predicted transcriptional regulator
MASQADRKIALLSIHPQYAEEILHGRKTVEFRKWVLNSAVTHVVVYVTAPISRIVGYFRVDYVDVSSPRELWHRYGDVGGISEKAFYTYFRGRATGAAIRIRSVSQLENPAPLEVAGLRAAPQGVAYLGPQVLPHLSRMVPAARSRKRSLLA